MTKYVLDSFAMIAYCFNAALASSLNALLLTGDLEFKKLTHELSIEWIAAK